MNKISNNLARARITRTAIYKRSKHSRNRGNFTTVPLDLWPCQFLRDHEKILTKFGLIYLIMASIYPIKPGELFEVPKDDKVTQCKMCYHVADPGDGIDLGPLYQYGKPLEGTQDVEIYW